MPMRLRKILGITGPTVLASESTRATDPKPTERLTLVIEEDGTVKALTDEQLHERENPT